MEEFKDLSVIYRVELQNKIKRNLITLSNSIKFIKDCKKDNSKNAYKYRMFSNQYIEQHYHKFAINISDDLYDIIYGYFAFHIKLSPYVYLLFKEAMKERGIKILKPPMNKHPLLIWSKKFNSYIIECNEIESDTYINFFLLFDLMAELYNNERVIDRLLKMEMSEYVFSNLMERIIKRNEDNMKKLLPLVLNNNHDFYVERPINICNPDQSKIDLINKINLLIQENL